MSDTALREHVAALLAWGEAHAPLERTVEGVPDGQWAARAPGMPHNLWELLEHVRITQHDILDFCRNPRYAQPKWPDDYWPDPAAKPSTDQVAASVAAFRKDRGALAALAADRHVDLFSRIPHGTGQTYLRELLLVADHTSYHLGQMVAVRRALGNWG